MLNGTTHIGKPPSCKAGNKRKWQPSAQQAEYAKFVNDLQNMSDGAFNQFMNNMETRANVMIGAQQKKGW